MHFPKALPDETLFSRYVRHMTVLGMHENDYLKLLFNRSRISIHPYITIGIKKACQITGEDELTIYRQQTLGRFFSYFIPHKSDDIYNAMLDANGDIAFRASQLVSFRESESLSLKYCPLCAKEDIRCYGVSYWHLTHQIPGVESCSDHQVWLIHQELPARPHLKFGLLPDASVEPKKCSDLSYKFANFTRTLLTKIMKDTSYYDKDSLIEKIKNHGYQLGLKSFKRAKLTSDLFNFTYGLTHYEQGFLPYSENDYRYTSYFLSGKISQHPFKYLLVDFWLNNIKNVESIVSTTGAKNTELIKNKTIEKQCITLLKQHESLAEISRLIGKSRCYIKSVAMKQKISFQKKPFILSESVIEQILAMAYKGFHRSTIAKKHLVSTGSVEQIISSETGLVKIRRRYKFESKRRRYKVQILRALQHNPLALKQDIKEFCYAAFHWLYRNEKDWLNSTLPTPVMPRVQSKICWTQRDKELAKQIKSILCNTNEDITRDQLDNKIGGNGWLIRMKHKLPTTMAILIEHDL
jgi:hypothetical protein